MNSNEKTTGLPTPEELRDFCGTIAQGILKQRVAIYEFEQKKKAFEAKWIEPLEKKMRKKRL